MFSIQERLLHRNVQRFRGGLVCKAHRPFYHSTLGLRVIKKNGCSRYAQISEQDMTRSLLRAPTLNKKTHLYYMRLSPSLARLFAAPPRSSCPPVSRPRPVGVFLMSEVPLYWCSPRPDQHLRCSTSTTYFQTPSNICKLLTTFKSQILQIFEGV